MFYKDTHKFRVAQMADYSLIITKAFIQIDEGLMRL